MSGVHDVGRGAAPERAAAAPAAAGAAAGGAAVERARGAAMPFIMATVLIDMVSIGLIVPVLPVIVGTFTGSTADQTFWFGVMTFAFSFANFVASPVLGALSDRYGRRPVLLLGFCALALSFFVTAAATALWVLVVVRLFSGAMQSNASVANAYVADISAPAERARRFGLLGAMFGIGFILGPVLGGVLGARDVRLPFVVAGCLALVNLMYGVFVLPESLPRERRRPFAWKAANPVASFRALAQGRGLGLLVGAVAFGGLAQFVLYTSWVLYTTFKFGWGPFENGWSLFVVGVTSALTQGLLLGRLLKRVSPQRLAAWGLVSQTAAYALYGAAGAGWMMFAITVVNVLGFTVNAAIQSIISAAVDERNQGQTLGAVSGLNSLMAVLAPLAATPLLGAVSHLPRGDWRIGAPFYFCALLQGAALLLAVRHFRRARAARARHA
jgi:DHA1 family tetracycline resistance protein-like MFS transporter